MFKKVVSEICIKAANERIVEMAGITRCGRKRGCLEKGRTRCGPQQDLQLMYMLSCRKIAEVSIRFPIIGHERR